MKNKHHLTVVSLLLILALWASAAEISGVAAAAPVEDQSSIQAPTPTPQAPPAKLAVIVTRSPSEADAASVSPQEVVHAVRPGSPVYFGHQYIPDCNTGSRIKPDANISLGLGCDRWEDNYIERPYDQGVKMYMPGLDIIQAQFGSDAEWIYARIVTYTDDTFSSSMDGVYAIEVDLDLDSRGDVLILARNPSQNGMEWGVAGVQVWLDTNEDVGGDTPGLADQNNPGNGYDKLVFDQGTGDDPDLAWVRLNPDQPNIVEFAFKPACLQNIPLFQWWTWTSLDELSPDTFDLVDSFAEDEIFNLDNTCSWIFGGAPRNLPNMCPYYNPTPTPKGPRIRKNDDPLAVPDEGCPEESCSDSCYYWSSSSCSCEPDLSCFN